ncbi:MAG: hypothetical protein RL653_1407 [Pseudomonadota bacterium]
MDVKALAVEGAPTMRTLLGVTATALLIGTSAHAQDFRDCTELYVYAVSARMAPTKPSGLAWDEGSSADPRLSARPSARTDLPWTVLGAKLQDAPPDVHWNPAQPSEAVGTWMPLRVGDELSVALEDVDLLASDMALGAKASIPKDLGREGAWFLKVDGDNSSVTVGVSAYDGTRMCKGVAGKPLWAKVPGGISAVIGIAQFNDLFAAMECAKAAGAPVCARTSHVVTHDDVNKDGFPDITSRSTAVHSTQDGNPRNMYGAWLGRPNGTTRLLFSGPCTSWEPAFNRDGDLCRTGDTSGTIVSLARGTTRAATAADFESAYQAVAAEMRALRGDEDLRGPPEPETLCRDDEVLETTCTIKGGKMASLCSKGDVLYYRFGTKAKVELEWPKAATPARLNFKWEDTDPESSSPGEVARTLSFQNGEFTYRLWEHQYRMHDDRTLSVSRKGKQVLEHACDSNMSLEGLGRLFR